MPAETCEKSAVLFLKIRNLPTAFKIFWYIFYMIVASSPRPQPVKGVSYTANFISLTTSKSFRGKEVFEQAIRL